MSLAKARSIEADLQTMIWSPERVPEVKVKKKKSFHKKIEYLISHMTIEPTLVFYILPSMMITIAVQNLNLEKACRVNLGISIEHCDALTSGNESAYPDYKRDEEQVQTLATYMSIMKNAIQSIIPGIMLLFLGAWSDKYQKRKLCMLLPVLGDMASVTGLLICTYFYYEIPMEVSSLCESLFPSLSGTWFAMFTGVYSYISDVSSEEERTLRVGAVNMLTNVAMCIGTALSGVLYEYTGFYGVYLIAMIMYSVSLGYGFIFIEDPCNQFSEDGAKIEKPKSNGFCRDFFQTEHITNTFKTAVKSGNKRGRSKRICIIMFLFVIVVGPFYGELNVVYFSVRLRYGWDAMQYSFFTTFQFVTNTLGTMFSLSIFSQHLKLDDSLLGIISCSTKILSAGIYAFATGSIIFYLGAVAEIFCGTSFIAMRAMISKLVDAEELGKINSLFGILEAVVPLVYGPLYSRVYALTIDVFPGCFYLVGGGLTMPTLLIFYWLYLEHKKDLKENTVKSVCEEKLFQKEKHLEQKKPGELRASSTF
ncbi:lysosomal proton-coupled steroid conjugate and bile acid symporter SLC46A3-like [Euwallacea fornicatus]|uniref:lysosomal proton-coupled steroid conjugate and bile acid symporter SLC46A3-like n=1 Tax=Euwallacea fornicatus TaxID=995702 RepID=UPI0033906F77